VWQADHAPAATATDADDNVTTSLTESRRSSGVCMSRNFVAIAAAVFLQVVSPGAIGQAKPQIKPDAQTDAPTQTATYPAMASLDQYLIPDKDSEIALARSGAPKSISDDAEVMVLGRDGYTTEAKGANGFLCLVERGWGASTDNPEFWNPKVRSPICFNPPAARSFAPIYLMKTKLALAGKSKAEIVQATASALSTKELRPLEPGAMCYMLSKSQYLADDVKSWHPHLMFFVAGDATKNWGANLPGSPIIAANDPEEGVTILMVWVAKWSDGTPGPPLVR
jgi:hypothetical protein